MAEAIYAKFLSSVLFFTKYKLHTVRSIVVDKVRSLSDATPYSHHTMSLHAAFGDLETLLTEREAATDNYCLLLAPLVKNGDTLADAVNLSPFYLDRSSFIGNSSGNYPALFAMDFKRVKESDFFDDEEEYVFHYIDKDINHDYAFAKDLELVINKVGAELPDHIEDRQKLSKSFIKVFQQIEQLNKDFPHNTQAD